MTSYRTTIIAIYFCAVGFSGCTWMPSRGGSGSAGPEFRSEPVDLSGSIAGVPPRPQALEPGSARSADGAAQAVASQMPGGGEPATQANIKKAVPVTEMSAFIKELEAASHLDAATRSEIMTTAFQTPPELQIQMIRQYRALLAHGRSADMASVGGASTSATSTGTAGTPAVEPVTAPFPTETTVPVGQEPVIAASHTEPIPAQVSAPSSEKELSGVERQLAALLREMRDTKGGPADRATSDDTKEEPSVAADEVGDGAGAEDRTWEQLVKAAIEKLEKRKEQRLDSELGEEDEARLRMLYLIAHRRDDAVRVIASLEPEMQEFWSKQLFGLATLLNSDLISDRSNRLIESKRNLDEALRRLGESAPLFVRNLAFITNVDSYGVYTPFDAYEFSPGDPVLLYAEVENYRCKETARGYHTSLRSTYEIFDSSRQKVAEHEFSTNEEYCKNPRRDFFTVCEFRMPENLDPGKYVLRLTVADLNGDKAGESSITFHIRGKD